MQNKHRSIFIDQLDLENASICRHDVIVTNNKLVLQILANSHIPVALY